MMATMNHHIRRQKRLIESVGTRVAAYAMTGSGHIRFVVVTPQGIEHLTCGSTPSDHRANKNMLARIRRWCALPATNEGAFAT